MNIAISEFLQGFGPGFLFSGRRRPGAATQVFATEDVPCDEEVQQTADTYISENALYDEQFSEIRGDVFDAIFPDPIIDQTQTMAPPIDLLGAQTSFPVAFTELVRMQAESLRREAEEAQDSESLDRMSARRRIKGLLSRSSTHPALRIHMASMETMLRQILNRPPTPEEQVRLEKVLRKVADSVGVSVLELGLTPTEQERMMEGLTRSQAEELLTRRKHHRDV